MVTINDRLAKIDNLDGLDWEIGKAEAFSRALKLKSQSALSLSEKRELARQSKEALEMAISMKLSYFNFDNSVEGGDSKAAKQSSTH